MPLIRTTVVAVLEQLGPVESRLDGRLALREDEAAASLGVQKHVLRDARRRGELKGAKVGKRVVYTREELLTYLREQQI